MKLKIIFIFVVFAASFLIAATILPVKVISLGDDRSVEPGLDLAISKNFDLVKDHYYIISGTLHFKPKLNAYVWPACQGNSFSRNVNCLIEIVSPYDNTAIDYVYIDNRYNYNARSFADFNAKCLGPDEYPIYFAFKASANYNDAQLFFHNEDYHISYTECGAATPTNYSAPVTIQKSTTITIQERDK